MVEHNVPFDVAFQLDPIDRCAWSIIFASFKGVEFDWSAMNFKEPK